MPAKPPPTMTMRGCGLEGMLKGIFYELLIGGLVLRFFEKTWEGWEVTLFVFVKELRSEKKWKKKKKNK
jgi:hypothetical protein